MNIILQEMGGYTLWFLGIAGALSMWLLNSVNSRHRLEREESKIFRVAIFSAIDGIYPDTNSWNHTLNAKIKQSIVTLEPVIENRMHQIGFFKRRRLSKAWSNYKNDCLHIDYKNEQAAVMYPDMVEERPSVIFTKHVKNLLKH